MPDWQNPKAYAYCRDISRPSWAWEFLRRNPEFIGSWDAFVALEDSSRRREALIDVRPAVPIPAVERQAMNVARDRARNEASRRWGLTSPCDPALTSLDIVPQWIEAVGVKILSGWQVDPGEGWPGYPSHVALRFDLRQPIEPQISHATSIVRGFAKQLAEEGIQLSRFKPTIRPNVERFILYLRLLDARDEGAGYGELGRSFFLSKADRLRSAKAAVRQAMRMASEGYRELLLMEIRPERRGEDRNGSYLPRGR